MGWRPRLKLVLQAEPKQEKGRRKAAFFVHVSAALFNVRSGYRTHGKAAQAVAASLHRQGGMYGG
jgi:hypothetical protein